ncbi:MAG TPA: tetratricopeptide repeat protein [Candidatus Binataceae bacterium]|jgi:tetratricopeptide (TPR) repeat protein|nr:tetratricopeptide repeat protein [Candidatus Binataceae bacterium]
MARKSHRLWIALCAVAALLLSGVARADDANRAKARSLVAAAIQLTDSTQALKMLWQATDIDPSLSESYVYLGLYYNSRENFGKVVEVYKKFTKYSPKEVSAYLNIGEAYMSFSPPRYDDALTYYRKAYEIDPHSGFAALRIGELLARNGDRSEAVRYLKQASAGSSSNPTIAAEASKQLRELAAF